MRISGSLFLMILFLSFAQNGHSQTGTPSREAISRENRLRGDSVAGNSVDTGTGSFVLSETTLTVQGARDLELRLNYNSLLTENSGVLGRGWSHEFEARIQGDPQQSVTVWWDVNHKNEFRFVSSGSNYLPVDESSKYDKLSRSTSGTWTLIRLDGTRYEFDSSGRLSSIGNKVQQKLNTQYETPGDRLTAITEPIAGRRLTLRYGRTAPAAGMLESVKDEADRIVFFSYDPVSQMLDTLRPPVTLNEEVQGTFFSPKTIPDNNPDGLTHTIVVSRSAPIGLVELSLANLSHTRPSDLTVRLISPQGTQFEFQNPSAPPGFTNPWDLTGMVLDAFDGENPQGNWRVVAIDSVTGSTGVLNGWTMQFSEPTDPTFLTYDSSGQITEARDPNGVRLYSNTYDSLGRVAAQDDGVDTNAVATFSYQTTSLGGAATTYSDRNRKSSLYEHDGAYRLLGYTDSLGNTVQYAYDGSGNRVRMTDALNRITIFSYDPSGNLITVVDPASLVWSMEYDSNGNLTSFRDPLGRTSTFQYDSRSNLTRVTDAEGHSDTKSYSSTSQMTGALMSDGGGINYGYSNGLPSTASHPGGGGNAGTGYDDIGRLTTLTDPDGFKTTFVYDSQSRIISKSDALGNRETKSYDRRGRLSQQTDRRGNRMTYTYDNNDNLTSTTDPLGLITTMEYDGEDRLIRTINPLGKAQITTFDAVGRKVGETDPEGVTTTYEYDAAGNLLAVRDSAGAIVEQYTYDSRDLQTSVADALGNKTVTTFNEVRRPVTIRDPLNRVSQWTYDRIDRLTAVKDPTGRTTTQSYLADDVVSQIVNANGSGVTFSYDKANRMSSRRFYGDNTPRLFSYNGRDLITADTQSSGSRRADYSYDSAGRLISVTRRPVSSSTPSATVSYRYDNNGNLTDVLSGTNNQSPSTKLVRTYDPLNRMTSFSDARGNTLRYKYDESGNLTELTYPDGKTVAYTYDDANKMTSIKDWAGRVTTYIYDHNGRMTKTLLPNETAREMSYDIAGRMTRRREVARDGGIIAEYRFSYNAAGELTSEGGTVSVAAAAVPSTTMTYSSDKISTVDGQSAFHDSDGNLVSFKNRQYQYDLNNNLTFADGVTYAYDEEDRLISFSSASGVTSFVINPASSLSQVLVRTASNGNITRYIYGAGLVYEETNGQIRTYHYDLRGSTVALADSNGAVSARLTYGPYGERITSNPPDTPFQYHGLFGVITGPTGLEYMRFRWYSPELKRFLNRDAHFGDISVAGSLNPFAFAGNNPVLRTDPEGQFWWVAAGALIGAIAAVTVKAASDLISGKFSGWQAYAGAAVGGAVTGAALAVCPTCGIAAGALGAAAGYAAEKGFRGQQVDPGELLAEAAFGGLAGGVSGGGGKLAGKLAGKVFGRSGGGSLLGKFGFRSGIFGNFGKQAARRAVFGRGDIIAQSLKRELPLGFVRGALSAAGSQLATVTGLAGLADRYVLNVATSIGLVGSTEGAPGTNTAKDEILSDGRLEVNANRKSRFGEFVHWTFWLENLKVAARPIPNNPNNLLTSF